MIDQGKVILQEGMLITRELVDRLLNWNIGVVDVQVSLPPASKQPEEVNAPSRAKLEAEMLERVAADELLSVVLDQLVQGIGRLYPSDNVFCTLMEGAPARWWVIASAGSFRLPDAALEQKFQGQAYLEGEAVTIGELSMHKAPPVLSRADMLSPVRSAYRCRRNDGRGVGTFFTSRGRFFTGRRSGFDSVCPPGGRSCSKFPQKGIVAADFG